MEPSKEKEKVPKRKRKFIGCSQLDHFELGQKVGVGTFGEVLKGKHVNSGKTVALKKIFTKTEQEGFPITSLREIKLLKNVSHVNVASLIDMAVSYKTDGEFKEIEDVYMVFPFMDHDLTGILENQSINLTLPQIKCYMKQLLEGISYLHSRQIMHRDLKGANLLVNNRGELKITDFGLARPLEENRIKYTPGVVTRWYRPPELLLGSDIYNESIDIWGIGCIIAEMYLRKPLFGATSDFDQFKMLCRYCGTPTEETYPGVGLLPDFSKIQMKPEKRILRSFLEMKQLDKEAIDLIDRMLVMDPKKRINAKEAIAHEYFTSEPLPCQPSEIGKMESSHVYTVQQQKEAEAEAEAAMSVGNKRVHEQDNYNNNKRRYLDHDARDHSRSQERLKYNDRLTPPPPPPPPIERIDHRHREYVNDDRHEDRYREYSGHRDHRGDYRDYDRRRDYDHRDYDRRSHSSHSNGHSSYSHSSHGQSHVNERNHHVSHVSYSSPRSPHDPSHDHPKSPVHVERRVVSTSTSTAASPYAKRQVQVAEVPPPPPPASASSQSSLERSRRAVSYDDL